MNEKISKQFNAIKKLEKRLNAKKATVPAISRDVLSAPAISDKPEPISTIDTIKASETGAPEVTDSLQSNLEAEMQITLEKAALSGKVNPCDLTNSDLTSIQEQQILSAVSADFLIESTDKVLWMLNQKKRREVLSGIIAEGDLNNKIAMPLPATDLFGEMLRKIIREGNKFQTDNLSQEEINTSIAVLDITSGINFPQPDINSIRKLIKPAELLDDYRSLTTHFFGREEELKKLHNFLYTSSPKMPFQWQGFVLTGLGGVGKSTLLAKFIEQILSVQKAPVVLLDFDRPGIDPEDSLWLEMEITRQFGYQYPQYDNELSLLRKDAREFNNMQGNVAQFSSENIESSRFSKSLIIEMGNILKSPEFNSLPFIIVLDTVEEASQRFLINKLVEWVSYLGEILYPVRLKVIFSGRLYDQALKEVKDIPQVTDFIELNEFEYAVAIQFFDEKVDPDTAHKILSSGLIPMRPLELKLIAQLLSEGTVTAEELLEELNETDKSGIAEELFAGIVYRRVLLRIKDPVLRKLSYPGLILRYLTPELIFNVLSPVLDISLQSPAEAGILLNQLIAHNWICYTDAAGKIWHRKDLRRSMIKLISQNEKEKVNAVREKAIAYFNEIGTKEARAESIYHELMKITEPEDSELPDLADLKEAYDFIESDIIDLPKPAAVLLRFAKDNSVNDRDAFLLPVKFLKETYQETGRHLVKNREFFNANRLYQRTKDIRTDFQTADRGLLDNWVQELLFATVEWDQIRLLSTHQKSFMENYPELSLVNYVFPACFINPEDLHPEDLERRVNNVVDNIKYLEKRIHGDEAATLIQRLACALVLIQLQKPLTAAIKSGMLKILEKFEHIDNSPVTERSKLLLHYVCNSKPPETYTISPSLIKLDPAWLKVLSAYIDQEYAGDENRYDKEVLDDTIKTIFPSDNSSGFGIRSKLFLSRLDGFRTKKGNPLKSRIHLQKREPAEILQIVKGPDSIFRDPCRYAILDAFNDHSDYKELAKIIQVILKVELDDLEPETFADKLILNPEQKLEPFIEIIDRSWVMGDFLNKACIARPDAEKLKTVAQAFQNWEKALTYCILQNG